MKKLVVFDLDGTLLDTMDDIKDALNHALSVCGAGPLTREDARVKIGHGLLNALSSALDASGCGTGREELETLYSRLLEYYSDHPVVHTLPYEGIPGILSLLIQRGVLVAICSNKRETILRKVLAVSFPLIPFVFIIGEKDGQPLKPDSTRLVREIDALGLSKEEVLYVGDSATDYMTARNAGVESIIVSYGARTAEELEEKGISDTVGDTKTLQEEIFRKIRG